MIHSDVISIRIHEDEGHKETFHIHVDLLSLHSPIQFRSHKEIKTKNEKRVLRKFKIDHESPTDFSQFMSWMYTGRHLFPTINKFSFFKLACRGWALGSRFDAFGYQNFCLDQLRAYASHTSQLLPQAFPTPLHVREVYGLKVKRDDVAELRKFIVESLKDLNNVLSVEENEAMEIFWQEVKDDLPGFAEDFNGHFGELAGLVGRPWNADMRERYLVEEEELLVTTMRHIKEKHNVDQLLAMEKDGSMYAEWALRILFDEDDTTDVYAMD